MVGANRIWVSVPESSIWPLLRFFQEPGPDSKLMRKCPMHLMTLYKDDISPPCDLWLFPGVIAGKGEVTVYAYEVGEDAPYLFPLSPVKCASPTQGLAFLHHKNVLNVRKVEFARAYRYSVYQSLFAYSIWIPVAGTS
jgi:hypothetical protein